MLVAIIFLLGLSLGSFVNALVWRLHEQAVAINKKQLTKSNQQLSVINGRSMCIHCRHTLAWYDLIPVVSWLSLKGKCRYCNKPISWQYPLVELVTAGLFVLSYSYFPYQLSGINYLLLAIWLVILTGFMALAVYDLRWMLLPDRITRPLTLLTIVYVLSYAISTSDIKAITGALGGLAIVGGLFYLLFQISDGKWIGGGDVKLGFTIGPLAGGFIEGFLLIFIASLLGTLASIPLLKSKNGLKKHIPFGPFLITATIIVFLFGADIISWYQNLVLVT